MAGEFSSRMQLCEAVEVKPGLPWRPRDVGDAGAMRCLQGELHMGQDGTGGGGGEGLGERSCCSQQSGTGGAVRAL